MTYSQAWLEDPKSIRALFVEAIVSKSTDGGTNWASETLYLSSTGYLTSDASVSFNPIIANRIKFAESITEDRSSLSSGDIELQNTNGALDSWLDPTKYVWANKTVNIYLGDPFWISSDITDFKTKFKLIFSGTVVDIDSKKRNVLNIKFADKLQRLNFPVTDAKLGTYGTWAEGQTNQDSIKPIPLGEPHNISPLYIDPSQLEYMFCGENAERIIEVRDNGVPIYTDKDSGTDLLGGIVYTATSGKFKLVYAPAGTITMSVQGLQKKVDLTSGTTTVGTTVGTYSNNIAEIIALLVKDYGNATQRFTASELDLTASAPSLVHFATNNTQPIGMYITGSESVLSVCSELAASAGAMLVISKEGKLQLIKYGEPFTDPSGITEITDNDLVFNSFNLKDRLNIRPSCTIGYCRNWTIQENLLTDIPDQNKADFAKEYFTVTSEIDSTLKTRYGLTIEPEQRNTLLVSKGTVTEASTVTNAAKLASNLKTLFGKQMSVYSMTGTSKLLSLKLGQSITLKYPRFDLDAGKAGQVVSLSPNWLAGTIDIEVLVL